MPWAETSRTRIIAALGLPFAPSFVSQVEQNMQSVERYGGDTAVQLVEQYLDAYDELDSQLTTEAANGSIIQADVIRWSDRGATGGVHDELLRKRLQIARLLNCEHLLHRPNTVRLVR